MNQSRKTLRLILGDQLNPGHSWLSEISDEVHYVLMEMRQETDYVKHHIQKITGFFLAMREFGRYLSEKGHQVIYLKINDPENQQDLRKNLESLIHKNHIDRFEYQLPDEYRLDKQLREISESLSIESRYADTEHFYTERESLQRFFKGKKQYLMEPFYRHMRKEFGILMDEENEPAGGRWNFDEENRKKLPKGIDLPAPSTFGHNVDEILDEIEKAGISHFGTIDPDNFIWPVNRGEALDLLDYFLKHLLPSYGTYQDAMTGRSWSLFHSRISFSLNTKMINPGEVVRKAEDQWRSNADQIDISQVEGFIRQILGWREYMRGIYWTFMPGYADKNYFNHQRKLPGWYWTGKTKMECLSHAIGQSLDYAYAHHIQRLMVTGNFGLLAGIHPDEMDAWYLGIYIDAIEWVEITNTRGMSQFADGGIVGSKPYVSSANYIHKMSDHCSGCHYRHSRKTGEGACPFNSLYWHFYDRHRDKLEKNPRIGMMYRTWDRMAPDKREALLDQAEKYMANLEEL